MNAPQFFGALVRAIGLYWLIYSLSYLTGFFDPPKDTDSRTYLIATVPGSLVGIFLMFKADGVVATLYAEPKGIPGDD
jgi:hypothetical protein